MLNNFVAVGRLVKDPELRKANNDTSICNVVLAIDNSLKEADGTRGTLFLDAKTFGDKTENIVKYCHKGSKVAVGGSLNQREFIRQDGSKGKVIYLVIDDVEFLDPKPQEPKEPETDDLPDDDLPFDSAGSLDGERYVDEDGKEKELKAVHPEPKFDPYTEKPLKAKAKK